MISNLPTHTDRLPSFGLVSQFRTGSDLIPEEIYEIVTW